MARLRQTPSNRGPVLMAICTAVVCSTANARAEQPYRVNWMRQFGGPASEGAKFVSADQAGNLYVAGQTGGELAAPNPRNQGAPFLAKFDANGDQIWIRQPDAIDNLSYGPAGVVADDLGNIFAPRFESRAGPDIVASYEAAGSLRWSNTLPRNGGRILGGVAVDDVGNAYATSWFVDSIRIQKFDRQTGTTVWTKSLSAPGPNGSYSMAVDHRGSIYFSGYAGELNSVSSAGGNDAFVAKFSENGDLIWTRLFGTDRQDIAFGCSTDMFGNVYSAGITEGSLGAPNPTNQQQLFVAKHDPEGNVIWKRQLEELALAQPNCAWADKSGNLFLTGSVRLVGSAFNDIFIAKLDAAGNLLWTKQMGTDAYEAPNGITGDELGNIYIACDSSGELGGPQLGGGDALVIKLSPVPEPAGWLLALPAVTAIATQVRKHRSLVH